MNPRLYVGLLVILAPCCALLLVPPPVWLIKVSFQVGAAFFWPFALFSLVLLLLVELHLTAPWLFPSAAVPPLRSICLKLMEFIQEIAPLFGFLGTLVGLISAFEQLGAGAEVMDLIGAMGVAMGTSLVGVVISAAAYSFRFVASAFAKSAAESASGHQT